MIIEMKELLQMRFIMNGFMFDTNIFNCISDNNIKIDWPTEFNYYITHIQFDELNKTRNLYRKNELLKTFKKIDQEEITTESMVCGISAVGKWKVSDGDLYEKLLARLKELDRKNKKWDNQARDILIAQKLV